VLILVRHGQTAANAKGVFLGRSDPPLTELGRRQADVLAAVDGVPTARRIITSPLTRAQQTAARLRASLEVDRRWIEMDYGDYEGLAWTDVPPDTEAAWRADSSWAPPGGESLLAVAKRVREACRDLADEATTADVVVVSHVSPIKVAVAWALGVGEEASWRMHLSVAAVCRIGFGRRGPFLATFDESTTVPNA
jgi:broad specificity phosphatase PhoE